VSPGCVANACISLSGRKTDFADAEWLARLLECGLVKGSFIPPAEIKAAREVIRYRAKMVQARTPGSASGWATPSKTPASRPGSVASSLTTKSARAMVEALIDGQRRPGLLAELAIGRMRVKIPDLRMALEGRFDDHHALMCRLHLDHIDQLDLIARLDAQIEAMMEPFRAQQGPAWRVPRLRRLRRVLPPARLRPFTYQTASGCPGRRLRARRLLPGGRHRRRDAPPSIAIQLPKLSAHTEV
jgi:transposase